MNICKKRLFKSNKIYVASLAPNIPEDNKEYKIYKSYLKCAFKDPTIKNIAITGNYGVGKSSFLKWFSRKKKYLFVSLCSFDQVDSEKSSLECNLIQQILIGCKPSGLKKYIWRCIIGIIAFSISFSIVYYLLAMNKMGCLNVMEGYFSDVDIKKYINNVKFYVYFIIGNLLFIGIPLLIIWITSLFSLKRLSFKAAEFETEIELDNNRKLSFINLYRMELVEALIRSAKKIDYTVIFEDMDRLRQNDCISLFTELREINRLVNLSHPKFGTAKKTVRFIYVIHDAVFNVERDIAYEKGKYKLDFYQLNHLKFFDYIMPIIPQFLDNSASNFIKSFFYEIGFQYSDEFIEIVDKEIDDFRIIQNIANEYCIIREIYKERFASKLCEEDEKHIMALAVYKTILSWDYQKIRIGKSLLQSKELKFEHNCISRLIEYKWLCQDCLKYVGLNEAELIKYVESLLTLEQLEQKSNIIRGVLKENYLISRNIILQKYELPYEKLISYLGYSLLSLELTSCENDLSVLKKMINNTSKMEIQIIEMYTDEIKEVVINYLKKASEIGTDEQILNVSIVLEYLLMFCDGESECFLDCECVSSLFTFKCYLKLSNIQKNKMLSNKLMKHCLNNAKKDPSILKEIRKLIESDYNEVKRLSQIDNLDSIFENLFLDIVQKEGT